MPAPNLLKNVFIAVTTAAVALAPLQSALANDCEHETDTIGGPLEYECDGCATTVCDADWYCCEVAWDDICAGEAGSMCVADPTSVLGSSLPEGNPNCPSGGIMLEIAGEPSYLCNEPAYPDAVIGKAQQLFYATTNTAYTKADQVHVDGGAYFLQINGTVSPSNAVTCRIRRSADNQTIATWSYAPLSDYSPRSFSMSGVSTDVGSTDLVFECKNPNGYGGNVKADAMIAIRVGSVTVQNNNF